MWLSINITSFSLCSKSEKAFKKEGRKSRVSHVQRIKESFSGMVNNPVLVGVLVLQAILVWLLIALFAIIDAGIVFYVGGLDPNALRMEVLVQTLFTGKILMVLLPVLLIQSLIIAVIDAFFRAGFYGMLKNTILDGMTQFKEFVPEAKRFFPQMFWFGCIRYLIVLILFLPLLIALKGTLSISPAMIADAQIMKIFAAGAFFAFGLFILFLFFLYGEAVIVFENLAAIPAIKRTCYLVKKYAGSSLVVILVAFAMMFALGAIEQLIYQILNFLSPEGARISDYVQTIVSLLYNILTIAIGIVISFYVLYTYRTLVKRKTQLARAAATKQKKKSSKKKVVKKSANKKAVKKIVKKKTIKKKSARTKK
jgi:hypothetical protein